MEDVHNAVLDWWDASFFYQSMNGIDGVRIDLKNQSYEQSRKFMMAVHRMIYAETPEARDGFYMEAMRDISEVASLLGRWRMKVADCQRKEASRDPAIIYMTVTPNGS